MKVGIFDSGMGGLSVLHQGYHSLPNIEYIYYADTDHVPYGTKKKEEIISYVNEVMEFFIAKRVDAILIACNTATSVAIQQMRKKYTVPILGMEPAIKPAVQENDGKRIMVIATPITVREEKLRNLIERVDEEHSIDLLALPKLVSFAEKEQFETEEVKRYLQLEFSKYSKENYSALVLGCTHFNYFKPTYRELFGNRIALIDGNHGTINHLADIIQEKVTEEEKDITFHSVEEMCAKYSTEYYISGRLVTKKEMLQHFMRMHNRLEEVRFI